MKIRCVCTVAHTTGSQTLNGYTTRPQCFMAARDATRYIICAQIHTDPSITSSYPYDIHATHSFTRTISPTRTTPFPLGTPLHPKHALFILFASTPERTFIMTLYGTAASRIPVFTSTLGSYMHDVQIHMSPSTTRLVITYETSRALRN